MTGGRLPWLPFPHHVVPAAAYVELGSLVPNGHAAAEAPLSCFSVPDRTLRERGCHYQRVFKFPRRLSQEVPAEVQEVKWTEVGCSRHRLGEQYPQPRGQPLRPSGPLGAPENTV